MRNNPQEDSFVSGESHAQNFQSENNITSKVLLSRGQKIATVFLAFFAIFTLVFWYFDSKKNFYDSFGTKDRQDTSAICEGGDCSGGQDDFKNKDTDKDGLSDYDELNLYKTSPYLADSDSDGFSDKREIESKNDPNCPQGVDCGTLVLPQKDVKQEDSVANGNNERTVSNGAKTVSDVQGVLDGQGDIGTLRQLLIDSGMDPKILEQISDEELMAQYNSVIKQK